MNTFSRIAVELFHQQYFDEIVDPHAPEDVFPRRLLSMVALSQLLYQRSTLRSTGTYNVISHCYSLFVQYRLSLN